MGSIKSYSSCLLFYFDCSVIILMRVRTNLCVLFSLFQLSSSLLSPDSTLLSARLLDSHLQDCAFKAFSNPRTGVPYDAEVPTNLTGVKVSALRLKSGSLRTRGFHSYKEFEIPNGVFENPYVERIVLVYHNLGNWSNQFYPLKGYSYLAPVLGLLAYNGSNLSASELPELDLRASNKPILIRFSNLKLAPNGSLAKCVYFDSHGLVHFDVVLNGSVCSTFQQGHFSIIMESKSNGPSQEVHNGGRYRNKSLWKIVVLCLVGGVLLLVILGFLVVGVRRAKHGRRVQEFEFTDDESEILEMRYIGDNVKGPLALGTRTRPMIENTLIP